MNRTLVSELICTRMSHDIIGNIGAVSNALELLEEGDVEFLEDICSILKTSSMVMSARLKFFRMAFGLGNANTEDVLGVCQVVADYLKTVGGKNYPTEADIKIEDASFSRVSMLAAMILSDVMAKGGKIEIVQNGNKLEARAKSVAFSAERVQDILDIIGNKDVEPQAQYAHVFYLKDYALGYNYDISLEKGEEIVLTIKRM